MDGSITIAGYCIEISRPEKELFPKNHITKMHLIEYYRQIAPFMIPLIKNRPVMLQRFPDGIDHKGFFQKEASDYFPSWIKTKTVANMHDGKVHYVLINDIQTLVYLANQACITPHIWLSSGDDIHKPDRMIFDLDPSGDSAFSRVRLVARKLKYILKERGLTPFVMTTGSRGLHVVVPIKPEYCFDQVRKYAYTIAHSLVDEYPRYITLQMSKELRGDRIFIDILRNSYGATGVAPYAVRALPGAPIATPLFWHELLRVTPQKYTMKNIFNRMSRVGDPWHAINASSSSLSLS